MANIDNLVHFTSDQDREKARINGAKGGRASGESRRRRKAMREALDDILSREFVDRNGKRAQGVEAMMARVFQDAMDGDMNAVKFIRDTVGEAPVQRVETVQIDQSAYDEVRKFLLGEQPKEGDE
jgi:hypothetical protein